MTAAVLAFTPPPVGAAETAPTDLAHWLPADAAPWRPCFERWPQAEAQRWRAVLAESAHAALQALLDTLAQQRVGRVVGQQRVAAVR